MKYKALFVLAAACFSSATFATTWVYDSANNPITAQWSAAVGTATQAGYFYNQDNPSEYIHDNYGAYDIFVFGETQGKISIAITSTQDVNIGGFILQGNNFENSVNLWGNKYVQNLSIYGDLVRAKGAGMGFLREWNNVSITGNIEVNGDNMQISVKSVSVGGDIVAAADRNANLYVDVGGSNKSFEDGIASPDFVAGLVRGYELEGGGYSDSVMNLQARQNDGRIYLQVGGVLGNSSLRHESQRRVQTCTSYFILANEAAYSTTGAVTEHGASNTWSESNGDVLALVMKGSESGVQEFTSNHLAFHGGVTVMSGALRLNFAQGTDGYTYYRDSNKKVLVTIVTADGGSTRTTFSHGDLDMRGGEFSSISGTGGYGAFRFTNIVYTDGTIKLRLDSEANKDMIDLTSYYVKVEDSTGDSTVVSYEKVEGGTISKTEGADKVKFDFGDNLAWLTGLEEDASGTKVISRDAENITELAAEDFVANLYDSGSQVYEALFTVADDGLYVKYVAVPEPATVALLFGFAALAFSAYRRKK